MLVAMGSVTAAVMIGAYPWDRAASKLIVENAGGICTDEKFNPISVFGNHRYFIASNGIVHHEVVDVLNRCLTKQ